MIALVISFNCLVALAGAYLAWRLWRWRQTLALWADQCSAWEASLRQGGHLALSPAQVLPSLEATLRWRRRYAYGRLFWGQVQQLIVLLRVMVALRRWLTPPGRRRRSSRGTGPIRAWRHREKR